MSTKKQTPPQPQGALAPGQPQEYKPFLLAWINKAVSRGGFTAEEASSALFALGQLQEPNTLPDEK